MMTRTTSTKNRRGMDEGSRQRYLEALDARDTLDMLVEKDLSGDGSLSYAEFAFVVAQFDFGSKTPSLATFLARST